MDDDRETRRRLQAAFDELAPFSEQARLVIGPYRAAIDALAAAADELWRLGEYRFSATVGSRVVDVEIQARRNMEAIGEREREAAKAAAKP